MKSLFLTYAAVVSCLLSAVGCAEPSATETSPPSEDNLTQTSCAVPSLVLSRSVQGVTLQMSQLEVVQLLGEPPQLTGDPNKPTAMSYGKTRIEFGTWAGKTSVSQVVTQDRTVRTKNGIGVGSSEADVQSKVYKVECKNFDVGRACRVGVDGVMEPGAPLTIFRIENGVVSEIVLLIEEG